MATEIEKHTTTMMDRLTRHLDSLMAKHLTTMPTNTDKDKPPPLSPKSNKSQEILQKIKINLEKESNKSPQELFITQILVSLAQARTSYSPKSLLHDLIKLLPLTDSNPPSINIQPGSNIYQLAEIACGPTSGEFSKVRTRIACSSKHGK